jgi:ABC-type dipeptide/oligopeptide/nickel transport system permease subunit
MRAFLRRLLWKRRTGGLGALIAGAIVLCAVAAPLIAPYPPAAQNLSNAYDPPSAAHWFGTDSFGRDVLARVLWGGRASLLIGLVAVSIAIMIGGTLGVVSGYAGGPIDRITSITVEIVMAFPLILLAIFIVGVFGTSSLNTMIAIGVGSVPSFVRFVRADVLALRQRDYIEAGRALGATDARIIARHVLPNVLASLVILATLRIGTAILAESSLSFLGLGVQIPDSSWGSMVAEGRTLIHRAPWMSLIPGVVIMVAVLAFNLLGDSLRDALDPRERGVT